MSRAASVRKLALLLGVWLALAGYTAVVVTGASASTAGARASQPTPRTNLPTPRTSQPTPHTSLPAIESQVMCVTCKIPLNVAQSPQSDRERAFIRGLIAEGRSEAQIKSALVAQYGQTVLALPSTHGFDLAAYLVPILAFALVLGLLLLLLPRWRRRAAERSALQAPTEETALNPSDAARLEADLARFD